MAIPIECERRFLVRGDAWRDAARDRQTIRQGYLAAEDGVTVRVRRTEDRAYLTVKAARQGPSCAEFEYEIPPEHADFLLATSCRRHTVEKTRHTIPHAGQTWLVDEFQGLNRGLVMAEIELERADQAVVLPGWVGPEVTASRRFKNSALSRHPFSLWGSRAA